MIDIKNFISSKNIDIYKNVIDKYSINLELHNLTSAKVKYPNKIATIYLPINATEECFTHELLHLYMECKDTLILSLFQGLIIEDNLIKKIFHDDLIIHITNCCQHEKMIKYFCEMGYDKSKFLFDSNLNKCTLEFANSIYVNYKYNNIYSKNAIDSFIGKFFAMKADISDFDYSKILQIFKRIDIELFNILDFFWNNWLNSNIENSSNYWDDGFLGDFFDNIKVWLNDKIII